MAYIYLQLKIGVLGKLILPSTARFSCIVTLSRYDTILFCYSSHFHLLYPCFTTMEDLGFQSFWPLFYGILETALGFFFSPVHGLRTPREEIAFTALQSQSQNFRYGRSIVCLPHQPNFSDIFDLCLHWVSVVRDFSLGFLIIKT